MRILVVEDDYAQVERMCIMLRMGEGWFVQETDLGEEALELARLYDHDLITLDTSLPDMSGFDVLRRLRERKIKTPVIIISDLCAVEDKVKGLNLGADDYVTKPFHKDEMVARILALTRRANGHAHSTITIGDLCLDIDAKRISIGGKHVHLTGKEYQMLELLAMRQGHTLTKEMMLDHIYGGRDEPEVKIIDVFICKLRAKMYKASGGKDYIRTVWGRGYALEDPATCPTPFFRDLSYRNAS